MSVAHTQKIPSPTPGKHRRMPIACAEFQSANTIALSLLIGSGGTLVLGILPLLLGALLERGTVDTTQLGWVGTAEVLAMAFGVLVGSRILNRPSARTIVFGAGCLMAVANLGTMVANGPNEVLLARGAAGLAEGFLVAVVVLSITYCNAPARLNAIFLAVNAVPQVLLAYLLPAVFFPIMGKSFGFALMAVVGFGCALLALCVRERMAPDPEEVSNRITWTPSVNLTLAASLIASAAIGACWSYAEPMATEIKLVPNEIGIAVAASLIFQVLGPLLVAWKGWRLPFRQVLVVEGAIQALTVTMIIRANSAIAFTVALCVFGFLWTGSIPFATDLFILVDSSRAIVPLLFPLGLAGMSAGPFFASFLVGQSVASAFYFGVFGFVASTMLYVAVFWLARKAKPPAEIAP